MSQEQFASVMSGGYSTSGNDGQPQYAGGQDGTACNAVQNADGSVAQYGAAGIAGQNGAMPGDRAESSMQAGGMDAGYEAYLASMGAAAQEAPFEGGTMVPAEAAAAANRMRPDAPAAGQSAPAMGQTAAFAAGTNGTASAGGRNAGGQSKYGKGKFNREGRGDYRRGVKKSDNPDVLYGRDFDEEAIPIEEIIGEMGEVVIRGKIIAMDQREIRNERTILIFDVTDFTDTMTIKIFTLNEQLAEVKEGIKPGAFVKIKGLTMVDKFDGELTVGSIVGVKKISDFTTSRMDHSVRKRVELHCHTKMSDMDGVSEVKDIVKRAYQWGHPAIAITDHGVVQSFPDANHLLDDLWKAEKEKRKAAGDENPDRNDFFKVIYGCEAYLVDDLKEIVTGDKGQVLRDSYVVFDIETTGFSPVKNRIIEIGAVKVVEGKIVDRFSTFVNPRVPIPFRIEQLTSINDEMVMDAPGIEEVLEILRGYDFCRPQCEFRYELYYGKCGAVKYRAASYICGYSRHCARAFAASGEAYAGCGRKNDGCFPGKSSPRSGRCGSNGGNFRKIYSASGAAQLSHPCGCEPFGRFQPGYCKETVFLPCDYPCEKRCGAGKSVPSGIGVSSDLLS